MEVCPGALWIAIYFGVVMVLGIIEAVAVESTRAQRACAILVILPFIIVPLAIPIMYVVAVFCGIEAFSWRLTAKVVLLQILVCFVWWTAIRAMTQCSATSIAFAGLRAYLEHKRLWM